MDRRRHWENVYRTRGAEEVSWFQPHARLSVELTLSYAPDRTTPVLDVGGGASMFADDLLLEKYVNITVLDLSPSALRVVRERLGAEAGNVRLVAADVTTADLPRASVGLWHDRAVFHFLTAAEDRARYLNQVRRCVVPGGLVLVATFAENGPTRCSGLDVSRYSPLELHSEFGPGFELLESRQEDHRTPGGATQGFTYCLCRYSPRVPAGPAA